MSKRPVVDHIGVDTAYHCINCGHHHCKVCGICHRCGCDKYIRNNGERKSLKYKKKKIYYR